MSGESQVNDTAIPILQFKNCCLKEYPSCILWNHNAMEDIPGFSKTTKVTRGLYDLFTLWSDLQK